MRLLPLLTTTATLLLALTSAQATGLATCGSGPKESWQSQARLEQMLKDKGWTVRRVMQDSRAKPRHLGHNPLGGWMIVALLGCALLAGGSGALCATDRFWGDPLLRSWLQRENLLRAMLDGRKRAPAPGDIGLG